MDDTQPQGWIEVVTQYFLDQIEQIKETVTTYMMFNGSINESANHLYIHKNTMQYRLNKVLEKTGLNPRELTDLVSLFLAINLYDKKEIS